MRSLARVVVVLGLLLLVVWGPWRVSVPEPGSGLVTPREGQPDPPPDGVRGEAVAASDVQGEPDRPIDEGYVVAIPVEGAASLWTAADLTAPEPHELPYVNFDVLLAAVEDAGGTVVAIDGARFALDVEAGDHLICLSRGHHPLQIAGCASITLAGDDRLLLSFGEGGVEVEALD